MLRGAEESAEPIGAYQIAGEPIGLLFAGHVDIEGFEAHIGVERVVLLGLAGEGGCEGGDAAGLGENVGNVRGDDRRLFADGELLRACVEVGEHIALVGGMSRRQLEDDAEGVQGILIGLGDAHGARCGIKRALLGNVALAVAEGGVVLVHGEAERLVETERSTLVDCGDNAPFLQVVRRGDAGEVDGLARRVFKVEHDGHPLGFRGDCRGRRGAHRGDEAHEQ